MASQDRRQRLALCAAAAVLGLLAGCGAEPREPLRVAVVSGPIGDAFQEAANRSGWKIEVAALSYEELLQCARAGVYGRACTIGRDDVLFDLLMIDDPWLPALASPPRLNKSEYPDYNERVAGLAGLGDVPIQPWLHPDCLALCKDDGQRLAVPFVANAQVLFYHAELLGTAPKSWNEVLNLAAHVESTQRVHGFAIRGARGHALVADFLPLLWAHGGNLDGSSGLTRRQALEALRLLLKLAEHAPPSYTGFDASELRAEFGQSQAAIALNWLASAGMLHDPGEMIPLPPLKEGEAAPPGVLSTWLLVVPRATDAPRQKEARSFLATLLAEKNLKDIIMSCDGLPMLADNGRLPCDRVRGLASRPRPRTRQWFEIEERLSFYLSAALTGMLTPEDAIDRAAFEIERIPPDRSLAVTRGPQRGFRDR